MAETIETPAHDHGAHGDHHHEETFWSKYVFSVDHKMIAMQYMFTGMFMALIGGFFAYVFRTQLAFPGAEVLGWGQITDVDQLELSGTDVKGWRAAGGRRDCGRRAVRARRDGLLRGQCRPALPAGSGGGTRQR